MRQRIRNWFVRSQEGQSLVLVALMFVGIIGFVGLAVDVGFIMVRNSQLQTAVDAAVLAGVTEITGPDTLAAANQRAAEFLHAHNLPIDVVTETFDDPANYSQGITIIGERQYSLTVTWPVDLFFLNVIGFESMNLTNTATAAHFPLADIYASRRVETGTVTTSVQGIFGPHLCVEYGDPFSSIGDWRAPIFREQWRGDPEDRTYHYRILIPPDYPSDILRVEIFDPDSINTTGNTAVVAHTKRAQQFLPATESLSCGGGVQKNPCLINTKEEQYFDIDLINPWWILRIDENRGSGTPPGNPNACAEPSSYTPGYNTITRYRLFYYSRAEDGSITVNELASYYGQAGDGRDASHFMSFDHKTDLRWVTPGGQRIFDYPALPYDVPTVCGSPNGGDYDPVYCSSGTPPGPGRGFEIEIPGDIPGILTDGSSGASYLYLDVESVSGGSENGFEIWAGTPDHIDSLSSDVNVRNVNVIDNPSALNSGGATVFGIGHLPMNSMYGEDIDIPLIYVGPEYAGTSVFVTHYDSDSGASPPLTFYFDSIAEEDWKMVFAQPGVPDPDGKTGRCIPPNCNTTFVEPAYEIYVPALTEQCTDPQDDDQKYICTPFYGGRLMVRYNGGVNDTYHWNINLSGLPYLIK